MGDPARFGIGGVDFRPGAIARGQTRGYGPVVIVEEVTDVER